MEETIDPLEKGRKGSKQEDEDEEENHLKCLKSISACLSALKRGVGEGNLRNFGETQ